MRSTVSLAAWPAVLVWLAFAMALFLLDHWWSLGNLALLLVLGSTLASYWLSTSVSVLTSALAVAGFNWFFVTPRYTFHVQLDQDLLLLVTMLGTSALISVLTTRLRLHAQQQTEQARQAERLQQLGTTLQHASTVDEQIRAACTLLQEWVGVPLVIWLQGQAPAADHPLFRAWQAGQQELSAIGPGTGRHESLNVLVLPLRAGVQRIGTLILGPVVLDGTGLPWPLDKLQALTLLMADEIQRLQSRLQSREVQDRLQSQQLRNTLLAAISHDYRTPLATITGAASGLLEVGLTSQVRQAATTILQESEHLHRMTSNTLQMARLEFPNASFDTSWESVEELCGVALAAARRRHVERQLESDVESQLPLLQCDPVLIVQLLDNLLENALRYSPQDVPVTLKAASHDGSILIQVMDRGVGIPLEWRERVFDPFRRVLPETRSDTGFAMAPRRGMGLGLALCQTIARLHQAQLWIEDRPGGGTVVCVRFATQDQPVQLPEMTQTGGLA